VSYIASQGVRSQRGKTLLGVVYAGGTYFYATDKERTDKEDRERLAIEK